MNKILLAPLLALVITACAGPSGTQHKQTESQRLNTWLDERYEQQMRFSPLTKTFYGIRDEDYSRVDDFSDAGQDQVLAWRKDTLADLRASFDYAALDADSQDSYDLWVYLNEKAIAADAFRDHHFPFDQMNGFHSLFAQLLISLHQVSSKEDMEAYIARIGGTARALRQLLDQAQRQAQSGVRAPYFAYDIVIQQTRDLITGRPFEQSPDDSPLWADIQAELEALHAAGELSDIELETMAAEAKQALVNAWQPAYEALLAWLEADRVNVPAQASGAGSLPDGAAFYRERLANHTTTELSAAQIHQLGLVNVERIHREMEKVMAQTDFQGTLPEFFDFLRSAKGDPRLYYPNTDAGRQAYLDDSTAAIDNIRKQLPDYFGLKPKADIVVKRVEAFREQPGAAQHYHASSPDGSRPGVYYAHLIDMTTMPRYELEVIAYHEGIPGHHMQIAIANELEGVPEFRKRARVTAFAEGWALYSERLASEMPGTYLDPYSDFGRLNTELWRAVRLVVDTGLHAMGWSEQRAVDYMVANSTTTLGQARSEVRRYIVMPGQATSYMVGMLKILELRERAQRELGEDFDIRAFHDTVLGQGALPLWLLERRVDRWIAGQRSARR